MCHRQDIQEVLQNLKSMDTVRLETVITVFNKLIIKVKQSHYRP